MNSPENISTKRAEQLIAYWQSKFQILKNWKIEFDCKAKYKSQCIHNALDKFAVIYDFEWSDPNELPLKIQQSEYIFHEIIHICQAALRHEQGKTGYLIGREAEELFVQNLCAIIFLGCKE